MVTLFSFHHEGHEGHEELRERNNGCHLSALMTAERAMRKLVELPLRALRVLRGYSLFIELFWRPEWRTTRMTKRPVGAIRPTPDRHLEWAE